MGIKPLSDYDLLPVYMRIAEDLRSNLGTAEFEFGSYLPGEHEIAAKYNLSRGTIRRALGILEADGLISRQPGRGTLILPPTELEIGPRPKIAVVWTMMRLLGLEMFTALEEHLSAANCDILFSSSQHDHLKEIEILNGLLYSDIDAVVLYSTGHPDTYLLIQQLQNRGKPVVLLDRFVQDQYNKLSWVTSENEQGAYALTRYLIQLRHKRIGMVMITPEFGQISTLVERVQGYKKAINEAGLEIILMKKCEVPEDQLNAVTFGKELIEFIVAQQPTAIFFHNDASAYRMFTVLNQNGIRIPQDLSIAGFDGLDLDYDLSSLNLTTVEQNFTGLGTEIGKLVLLFIRNPNHQARQIRIPTKLRIGNTTAPPRQDSESRKLMPQISAAD